jgi:hypothetical protein
MTSMSTVGTWQPSERLHRLAERRGTPITKSCLGLRAYVRDSTAPLRTGLKWFASEPEWNPYAPGRNKGTFMHAYNTLERWTGAYLEASAHVGFEVEGIDGIRSAAQVEKTFVRRRENDAAVSTR